MTRRWFYRGFSAFLPALAIFLWAQWDPWNSWSAWTSQLNDWRFQFQTRSPSDSVVFLEIDQSTEKKFGRWPWNRAALADTLQHLANRGIIALDMVFPAKTDREADRKLAQTLANSPNMVLGISLRHTPTGQEASMLPALLPSTLPGYASSPDRPLFPEFPGFETSASLLEWWPSGAMAPLQGSMNVLPDPDNHIRHYPTALQFLQTDKTGKVTPYPLPSLALQALRMHAHQQTSDFPSVDSDPWQAIHDFSLFPHDEQGRVTLHFYSPDAYPSISFMEFVEGNINPEFFSDKIVVVGLSEAGVADIVDTPVGRMPGPLVHCTFLHNVLQGHLLKAPPLWVSLMALLAVILVLAVSPLPSFPLRLVLYTVFAALAGAKQFLLFNEWLIDTDLAAQLGILLAAVAGTEGALFQSSQRRLRRLEKTILHPEQIQSSSPDRHGFATGLPAEPFPAIVVRVQWLTIDPARKLHPRQSLESLNQFQDSLYNRISACKGTALEIQPTSCSVMYGLEQKLQWDAALNLIRDLQQLAAPTPPDDSLYPGAHPLRPVGAMAFGDAGVGWCGMESCRQPGILGRVADAAWELLFLSRTFGKGTFLTDQTAADHLHNQAICLRPIPLPWPAVQYTPPLYQLMPDNARSRLLSEQFNLACDSFKDGNDQQARSTIRHCAEFYLDPLAQQWELLFGISSSRQKPMPTPNSNK